MPYDRPTVAANVGLGAARGAVQVGHAGPSTASAANDRDRSIPGPVLTGLAYGLVALPFVVALGRLLSQSSAHLILTDDLALIDLHTREAVAWHQQLGVFDRNGWSHPGPSYFYLLGMAFRIFGSNARSLFLGATFLNGAAAVACVAVVRRWTTATRALWSSFALGLLIFAMAASGAGNTTYSETVLGALVSPWNPLVVILPLLLLLLLCAGAMARSTLAAVGVLVVGTFVIQTDVSTFPLVAAASVAGGVTWLVRTLLRRRDPTATSGRPLAVRGRVLVVAGLGLVALAWVPPLVQQFTNNPGNVTLIYRYFTSGRPGHGWVTALGATAASTAVYLVGPSEVMLKALEGSQPNQVLAALVLVVTVAVGLAAVGLGRGRRPRFGAALGGLAALGCLAVAVGVSHLIGHIYGYLVVWAVVLPAAALISIGSVRFPGWASAGLSQHVGRARLRGALVGLVAVVSVASAVRVAAMPPLTRVSDPEVAQIAALVVPHLKPGETVSVDDVAAGHGKNDVLINIERFFGLVNVLDRDGYQPKVNKLWVVELAPGFFDNGTAPKTVLLTTWTAFSPSEHGYLGRVGDLAVAVVGRGQVPLTLI